VNGYRLAYRGLLAGLAGSWVWLAVALAGGLLIGASPAEAARLLGAGSAPDGLVAGAAMVQVLGALIGIGFAYFFGRYFTVRTTLQLAAPAFSLLASLAAADLLGQLVRIGLADQLVLSAAALAYGLVLGSALPVRGEVLREGADAGRYPSGSSGSPAT
jgi:hypothetical protein